MSALPQPDAPLSEADYLAFERASQDKHQFIGGEIVAMTGASRNHNLIAGNTYASLHGQVRGQGCESYIADMKVRTPGTGSYVYPDITIVCGDARFDDPQADVLLNPTLVTEVLSPSTEAFDRGGKFQRYREIDSLREYLLIAQDAQRVERFERSDGGLWLFTEAHGPGAALALTSINATLALDEVYAQVRFPTDADEASR